MTSRFLWAFAAIVFALSSMACAEEQATSGAKAKQGPLADYIAQPDESFGWVKRAEGQIGQVTYAELILTSQTWRGIVWKHQLFIIKPKQMAADVSHALLLVDGGSWRDDLADPSSPSRLPREGVMFAAIAEQLGTPMAIVRQVPHQPIFEGRKEDAAIALTFDEYLKTGDATWPLLLPMVNSAVRAMDAVQEFSNQDWSLDLKTFTVTGASKRGWTTWLTGAVDERAIAIAPMVIDMLNMAAQMEHQKATWGDFSYKIDDYTERGLQEKLRADEGEALRRIVDPYSYRQWIAQPKLIMLGTNDHYWPLDALNLYWNDLSGPKYILYVPNNGHGLNDITRIVGSLNALHQQAANGFKMPQLTWSLVDNGRSSALRLRCDVAPKTVRAWTTASESRDFRQAAWKASTLKADGDQAFVHVLDAPDSGYAAMFCEAEFDNLSTPYYLSTNVSIVGSVSGE